MVGGFGPLGRFSSKAAEEELAAAVGEEGIMAVGAEEPMKGSLTKRKAEKALSPTGEKGPLEGCATKRKAEEPAAGWLMAEKTADLMAAACGEGELAAAGGDGKGAPAAAAGGDGKGVPAAAAGGDGKGVPAAATGGDDKGAPAAGSMEVESSSSEEEEEEEGDYDFLATLSPRVIDIAMAEMNIPGLVISNCFSDFYETEEEEECESDNEDGDEDEEGEGEVDKLLETN